MYKKVFLSCMLLIAGRQGFAQTPERGITAYKGNITIYEHSNYEGASKKMIAGKYNLAQLGIGNDQLSSVKVPKGFKVTLFEHGNFQGTTLVLTADTQFVGNDFNDLTSSIIVEEMSNLPIPKPKPKPEPRPKPKPDNNPVVELPSFKGCPTGSENVPAQNEAHEKKILEIVNAERAKVGKPALVWNKNLARAARYHAADMAIEGYFTHDSFDVVNGDKVKVCDTFERIAKFGKGYAENIAWGSDSPEGAMNQWINSPGHYKNIMSDNTSIGVGFYNNYWVQVFGPKE